MLFKRITFYIVKISLTNQYIPYGKAYFDNHRDEFFNKKFSYWYDERGSLYFNTPFEIVKEIEFSEDSTFDYVQKYLQNEIEKLKVNEEFENG